MAFETLKGRRCGIQLKGGRKLSVCASCLAAHSDVCLQQASLPPTEFINLTASIPGPPLHHKPISLHRIFTSVASIGGWRAQGRFGLAGLRKYTKLPFKGILLLYHFLLSLSCFSFILYPPPLSLFYSLLFYYAFSSSFSDCISLSLKQDFSISWFRSADKRLQHFLSRSSSLWLGASI